MLLQRNINAFYILLIYTTLQKKSRSPNIGQN